jgi:hypothetical protein
MLTMYETDGEHPRTEPETRAAGALLDAAVKTVALLDRDDPPAVILREIRAVFDPSRASVEPGLTTLAVALQWYSDDLREVAKIDGTNEITPHDQAALARAQQLLETLNRPAHVAPATVPVVATPIAVAPVDPEIGVLVLRWDPADMCWHVEEHQHDGVVPLYATGRIEMAVDLIRQGRGDAPSVPGGGTSHPMPWPGGPHTRTHSFIAGVDGEERCRECDCRPFGIAAKWPCNVDPPRVITTSDGKRVW